MFRISTVLLGVFATAFAGTAAAQSAGGPDTSAHDFVFEMPHGEPLALKDFAGKPVLIVNTATECGFSGQLSDLQQLHETFGPRGLVVLGVPSNDFGGQEPRSDQEIGAFCQAEYGASFPLAAKTSVRGETAHPFYRWAAESLGTAARPYWNFHKYLVGPDGQIEDWFTTPTKPTSRKVAAAIEKLLPQNPGSQSGG